jgi:biopolymer transport protein TolR
MGVSIADGGRGRTLVAELNLVPFIDLLSVCITFLLATSVWTVIASMSVDSGVSSTVPPGEPPPPPLVLTVRADGVHLRTPAGDERVIPRDDGEIDKAALAVEVGPLHLDDDAVFVLTEDGIAFADVIAVLDVAKTAGFERPHLGAASREAP